MVWVGRDLKSHLVPTSCNEQRHFLLVQVAQSHIQPGLEHCRDGASTAPLGNLRLFSPFCFGTIYPQDIQRREPEPLQVCARHWTLWNPWGFGVSTGNLMEVSAGGSTRESLSVVELLDGWWWRSTWTGTQPDCQQHRDLEQEEEEEEGTHAAHSSPSSYFPCLWDWSDGCMSQCLGWERGDRAPGSGITHHRAPSITALPWLVAGDLPGAACHDSGASHPATQPAQPVCPAARGWDSLRVGVPVWLGRGPVWQRAQSPASGRESTSRRAVLVVGA